MHLADLVLELLYDRRDASISLGEIAGAAGAGPEDLRVAIKTLGDRGHRIELSPDGLARLTRPIPLDGHLIERGLPAGRIGRHVICFREVDSTNDVAFDSARQADSDGLVVLAESQRIGRGRIGRKWHSPPLANILMSALLMDNREQMHLGGLTVAAGLAVAESIEQRVGLPARLRWPNDVLLEGGKVAGVLTETRRIAERPAVVIGMGINVNACPTPEQVDHLATSIAAQTGRTVDRTELIRAVICRLDYWVQQLSDARLEGLHKAWVSRCDMLGARATVICDQRRYVGRVLDISPLDKLVLAADDGRRVSLPAERSTLLSNE